MQDDQFVVALMGARMHYAVPRIFWQHKVLSRFYTDICLNAGWPAFLRWLPSGILPRGLKRLAGRHVADVPPKLIAAFTGFGLEYQRRRARSRSVSEMTAVHLWAGERFCRLILDAKPPGDAGLYCFNSAGLELLRDWRSRGRRALVEQTIAPRRVEERILFEEEAAFPGWQEPLPRDANVNAYIAREEAEWREADGIVCGSEFVRSGVGECGGPVDRCIVVPYGIPFTPEDAVIRAPLAGRKLRVLTVGEIGLRKGSHYVLQSARRLSGHAEFRMVGPIALLPQRLAELEAVAQYAGISPRSEISRHFNWADVFLLPSLCEGSATVTYEALSAGLPVVTTPSSGSIVEDGVSGFIVPERSAEEIVAALEKFLSISGKLVQMSRAAKERAMFGGLDAYGQRLMQVIRQ